jgi:hypothetical protein
MPSRPPLSQRLAQYPRNPTEESRASLLQFGWKLHAAVTSHSSGPIEMLAGDPVAAGAERRRDYGVLEEMDDNSHLSTTAAFLAEALFKQGRLEEPGLGGSAFLDLAEVLALDQKPEQARQALERAVALFPAKETS